MDANELRALQAPLKKRYRERAGTALTLARAEAMLDADRLACGVRSWGGETEAGLHPATGGDGSLACSADMLLEALVACAGVTVSAVATAMGVKLRGGRVIAEGHWDARGTLGVDREAPALGAPEPGRRAPAFEDVVVGLRALRGTRRCRCTG